MPTRRLRRVRRRRGVTTAALSVVCAVRVWGGVRLGLNVPGDRMVDLFVSYSLNRPQLKPSFIRVFISEAVC